MLTVKRFTSGPLLENGYLLYDEAGNAALLDPGMTTPTEARRLTDYIEAEGLTLQHVLLTHAHFDHVFGLPYIYSRYHLQPLVHALDLPVYHSFHRMLRELGLPDTDAQLPPIGGYIAHGSQIEVGSDRLTVLHTPGHTPGGVCFYSEESQLLFSGDTLFNSSIGRTDFEGGSHEALIEAIHRHLLVLPGSTTVLTGHGGRTTIAHELVSNPYL